MSSTEPSGSERGESGSFEGLLFEGNPRDKSWTLICEGSVTMTICPPGGKAGASIVASQQGEKVWECGIGPGLKHRVKDNFLQWQYKSSDGAPMTFGLRLKTAQLAQQLNTTLAATLSPTSIKHKKAPSVSDSVVLKIIPPSGEPMSLTLPPTTTITQVMAIVAEKRKLNPAHYNMALPPEDPKGEGVACFGSMSVSRLKTHTLYLRRQGGLGVPEEPRLNSTDVVVHVDLPRGEKTIVKASALTLLPELLQVVCRKRRLDAQEFQFDLPATEDSLAGKTLGQLRINSLRLIPREDVEEVKVTLKELSKVQDSHTLADSPKGGSRRHAPPPPPQLRRGAASSPPPPQLRRGAASSPPPPQLRQGAASLMKELSAEVTERLRDRGEGGGEVAMETGSSEQKPGRKRSPVPTVSVATPPDTARGEVSQDNRPLPPPVASKPKRKPVVEEVGVGGESPSIPRSALDSLVLGIKVREAAERPEMGSITEGLKLTAASGGRYVSVKKRRQQSVEEPAMSTQPWPSGPRDRPRSREMEDINVLLHPLSSITSRNTRSHCRKPQGPAPILPRMNPLREQRTATLGRRTLEMAKERKAEGLVNGTMVRRPVRKAPVRPAPVKAGPNLNSEQTKPKATPLNEAILSSAPTGSMSSSEEAIQQQLDALERRMEAVQQQREAVEATQQGEEEEVDFSGYEFHPLTPPKAQSPPLRPPTTSSASTPSHSHHSTPNSVSPHHSPVTAHSRPSITAHVEDKEGGGKRLIIKPSPGSTRKTNIVFNLPPPPPPPQFNGAEERGEGERRGEEKGGRREEEGKGWRKGEAGAPEDVQREEEDKETRDNGHSPVGSTDEPCRTSPQPPPTAPSIAMAAVSGHSVLNGESILSNEYTNLDDDSDNEVITDMEPMEGDTEHSSTLKEDRKVSPGQDVCDLSLEHVVTTAIEEVSYDTSLNDGGDGASDSGTSTGVQGYDTASAEERELGGEMDSPDMGRRGEEGEKLLPPPLEEHVNLALNCNGNNNIDTFTFPPPPLEFVAPSEKFLMPAPLQGFEMPHKPVFDERNSEVLEQKNEKEGGGGVVLVAMTTHREDMPIAVAKMEEVSEDVMSVGGDKIMKGSESSTSMKSIGTQLSELDSMVTSIQDMVAESSLSLSPLPSPPPPPPPLPVTTPPSVTKTPLPPRPPPPVLLPSPKKAMTTPKPTSPGPAQPLPGSRQLCFGSGKIDPDNAHAELKEKLATKLEHLQLQAAHTAATHSPPEHSPIPNLPIQQSTGSIPPPGRATGPHPSPTSGNLPGSGGDMQFQLQFLQQQFLQQQMLQLQQQFSQLQHSIHLPQHTVPAAMAMLSPSIYPQHMHTHPRMVAMPTAGMPISDAMPMAGMQSVGPSVAMSTTGMVPIGTIPLNMMAQPHLPTAPSYSPPHSSPSLHSSSPPHSSPSLHTPGTLPSSPPVPTPMTSTPTSHAHEMPRPHNNSTSELRAGALGDLEPQFDRLMEDMRETDTAELLKKLSPEEAERVAEGGSYSGMAAVLAEALKERRKHFAEKHNRSVSEAADESTVSEWDT